MARTITLGPSAGASWMELATTRRYGDRATQRAASGLSTLTPCRAFMPRGRRRPQPLRANPSFQGSGVQPPMEGGPVDDGDLPPTCRRASRSRARRCGTAPTSSRAWLDVAGVPGATRSRRTSAISLMTPPPRFDLSGIFSIGRTTSFVPAVRRVRLVRSLAVRPLPAPARAVPGRRQSVHRGGDTSAQVDRSGLGDSRHTLRTRFSVHNRSCVVPLSPDRPSCGTTPR